jgi:hypothetical protein
MTCGGQLMHDMHVGEIWTFWELKAPVSLILPSRELTQLFFFLPINMFISEVRLELYILIYRNNTQMTNKEGARRRMRRRRPEGR